MGASARRAPPRQPDRQAFRLPCLSPLRRRLSPAGVLRRRGSLSELPGAEACAAAGLARSRPRPFAGEVSRLPCDPGALHNVFRGGNATVPLDSVEERIPHRDPANFESTQQVRPRNCDIFAAREPLGVLKQVAFQRGRREHQCVYEVFSSVGERLLVTLLLCPMRLQQFGQPIVAPLGRPIPWGLTVVIH